MRNFLLFTICATHHPLSDVWSAGTVMAEAILGRPLFCGDSAVNQLAAIIKVGSRFPLYRMRMKTSVNFSKAYGMQSFKIHVHGVSLRQFYDFV